MKSGAVTFLTKPIDEVALIAGVERALDLNRTYSKEAFEHSPPREQQVLPLLASGPLNKQAAGELGSPKCCANAPWNYHAENGSRFLCGPS
jgi:FixJ family two-component response regulator